ncbi:terminase small subunit [Bordetella trematum]|uniref:terminase small subunit n=1 Tax=Bordetella trematum TaxID=123899 RepID=UPI000D8A9A01|nr:terminase small subunit [Bordetella trematum]SPU49854.1 Terminase small subunit [Bordetella trematum]VDH07598.1 Terminase small subunit [Bordetella trematum]
MRMNPDSERARLFVQEYLVDLNATAAAERAGYSKRSAKQIGYALLQLPLIRERIAAAQQERIARTQITQDNVLQELSSMTLYDAGEIGRYQITKPEDVQKLPEHLRRCVVGWSWDKAGNFVLKLADKLGAATLAMRHLGMLNDKLTIQRPRVTRRDLTGRKDT